jgi:hypothetical protein
MENKKNYCEICEEQYSSGSTYNRHLKSKGHLKKLYESEQSNPKREDKFKLSEKEFLKQETGEKYKLEPKTEKNVYLCEFCNYETSDSGNFSHHKTTLSHQKNMEKVQLGIKEAVVGESLEELNKIKENLMGDLKKVELRKKKAMKVIKENEKDEEQINYVEVDFDKKKVNVAEKAIADLMKRLEVVDNKIKTFDKSKPSMVGGVITVKEQEKKKEKAIVSKKAIIARIKKYDEGMESSKFLIENSKMKIDKLKNKKELTEKDKQSLKNLMETLDENETDYNYLKAKKIKQEKLYDELYKTS